jgi:hypothetical protein
MARKSVRYRGKPRSASKRKSAAQRKKKYRAVNVRTGGYSGLEVKFLDSELTATALATTWAAYNPTGTGCTDSISVPAVGTSESERIGRRYTIKSILVKGFMKCTATEAATSPPGDLTGRVIVYWDTQTNSAEATATDIMDGGGSNDVLAWRNLQNSRRFIVLYDKTIVLRPEITSVANDDFDRQPKTYMFKLFKNFREGIEVTCDGTTANVSSVSDNNIGIAAVAESTAVTLEYQARVRFCG